MVTIDARAGKWLVIALFLSVAVNLFLGGLIAGRFAAGERGQVALPAISAGQQRPGPIMQRMLAVVPEAERPIIEAAFAKRRGEFQAAQQAVRQARQRVGAIMAAEPHDPQAQAAAFTELRGRVEASQRLLHEALTEAAQKLSPAARKQLVEFGRQNQNR